MNSPLLMQRAIGGTAAGLLLGIVASSQAILSDEVPEADGNLAGIDERIFSRHESGSFGSYIQWYSGAYECPQNSGEQLLAEAYTAFVSAQRPLEAEIADILERNLWDLYSR